MAAGTRAIGTKIWCDWGHFRTRLEKGHVPVEKRCSCEVAMLVFSLHLGKLLGSEVLIWKCIFFVCSENYPTKIDCHSEKQPWGHQSRQYPWRVWFGFWGGKMGLGSLVIWCCKVVPFLFGMISHMKVDGLQGNGIEQRRVLLRAVNKSYIYHTQSTSTVDQGVGKSIVPMALFPAPSVQAILHWLAAASTAVRTRAVKGRFDREGVSLMCRESRRDDRRSQLYHFCFQNIPKTSQKQQICTTMLSLWVFGMILVECSPSRMNDL